MKMQRRTFYKIATRRVVLGTEMCTITPRTAKIAIKVEEDAVSNKAEATMADEEDEEAVEEVVVDTMIKIKAMEAISNSNSHLNSTIMVLLLKLRCSSSQRLLQLLKHSITLGYHK